MARIETRPADVVAMGARVAALAAGMRGDERAVGDGPVDGPPRTVAALARFATAYGDTVRNLGDDVVALGRLTQVAGANYERVEACAARRFAPEARGG